LACRTTWLRGEAICWCRTPTIPAIKGEQWKSKGAEFVTPLIDRGVEIRCYIRDPDAYMIEVG